MSESNRASSSRPELDEIFIRIPEDLGPATFPERCIYRVPQSLRIVNQSAYTPNLVSIGPLHHDDKRFQAMQTQKLRYLRDFCERTGMTSSQLAEPIKEKEETIRRSYAETLELRDDKFIRMILLDAVFIVELFLRFYEANMEDYILSKPWMLVNTRRDLLILENQLPWFILEDFFNFSFPNEKYPRSFFELFACFMRLEKKSVPSDQKQNELNGDSWFSFPYCYWSKPIYPPKYRMIGQDELDAETNKKSPEETPNGFHQDSIIRKFHEKEEAQQEKSLLHFVDVLRKAMTFKLESRTRSQNSINKLYSATKLHEAGVKFKLSSRESHQLGITFEAGALSMPLFEVDDTSECMYRNLMAFEQCHLPYHTYVCDFIVFLDYLIDSENDVDLLVQSGVVGNSTRENKAVSRMVNSLCKEIHQTGSLHYDLCEELNAHAENWWNRSVATLRNVYFANIWRGTGTVAAFVLLVLTFIQAFYAVKQG